MYFTMDSLNQVHFLYQYSLKFFLDIFNSVLFNNKQLTELSDYTQRLNVITKQLFNVSETLSDNLSLSLLLQIKYLDYSVFHYFNKSTS